MADPFIEEMVPLIRKGKDGDSAMQEAACARFCEEVAVSNRAQLDVKIPALELALKQAGLQTIACAKDDKGEFTKVSLAPRTRFFGGDPWSLYVKPEVKGTPLADSRLEALAEHFEAVKAVDLTRSRPGSLGQAVRSAEFLRDRSLELKPDEQYRVLKRASDLSLYRGHTLNAVFADLNGDGIRHELSDLAINYKRYVDYQSGSIERIDIYDPDRRPEK